MLRIATDMAIPEIGIAVNDLHLVQQDGDRQQQDIDEPKG